MGPGMNLRDQSFERDRQRIATQAILARCRSILDTLTEFHIASVAIGRYEAVIESGALVGELEKAQKYMEQGARLQSDIDRLTAEGLK